MKVRTIVSVVMALWFLGANGQGLLAATRYVSPTGSNTPPYGTWENASHTIQAAVDSSSVGDTVLVGAGRYSPDSDEQFPIVIGPPQDSLTVTGVRGAAQTTIDAKDTGPVLVLQDLHEATLRGMTLTGGSSEGIAIRRQEGGACDLRVVGCRIMNNDGYGVTGDLGADIGVLGSVISGNGVCGVRNLEGYIHLIECSITGNKSHGVEGMDDILLQDSEVLGNGGAGVLGRSMRLARTELSHNQGRGVWCGEGSAVMEKCIVTGNGGPGIEMQDAMGLTATACTIVNNLGHGISGSASGLSVSNSIVSGNGGMGVFAVPPTPDIAFCCFWNNQGGAINIGYPQTPPGLGVVDSVNVNGDSCDAYSNIYLDPLFADAAGDYHLLPMSRCIDAGDPDLPYDPDLTVCDMGALYFDQLFTDVGEGAGVPPAVAGATLSVSPNPFNPMCTIRYATPQVGKVRLMVSDVSGSLVRTFAGGWREPGTYYEVWDGRDNAGTEVPSGIYFCSIKAGDFVATRKMVLLR